MIWLLRLCFVDKNLFKRNLQPNTEPMAEEKPASEKEKLMIDVATLSIFWMADRGILMSAEVFHKHLMLMVKKTGLGPDRLIEVYEFIQTSIAQMSFHSGPRHKEVSGFGKRNPEETS